MKIGIYSPSFRGVSTEAGVGTYTGHLGDRLSKMGHEVHVLTLGFPRRVCQDGPISVHVTPQGYVPLVERFLPGSYNCCQVGRQMRRMASKHQLDVFELANWEGLGVWFAARRSIPIVVRLHTSSLEAHTINADPIRGAVKWDVRREKWQALLADALVTHSEAHRLEMAAELNISKDRISVIPHGVPVFPQFHRAPAQTNDLNVVCLGRLENRKGTVDLLNAAPKILAAVPSARFTFIGKDRDHCPGNRTHAQYIRDEFPAEVQARIHLTGHVSNDDVDRLLQTADVFAAPSLYESFGLVFLEAMRWGTAVVGTRAGAIPEIIDHGQTGLLVKPQSPAELADAIISLLKDPARRQELGDAGRLRVETRYTVERMAQQVQDLYEDVIAEWKRKTGRRGNRKTASRTSSDGLSRESPVGREFPVHR
jgi:glycosyltransferase involved in cell wall biosynthesis